MIELWRFVALQILEIRKGSFPLEKERKEHLKCRIKQEPLTIWEQLEIYEEDVNYARSVIV